MIIIKHTQLNDIMLWCDKEGYRYGEEYYWRVVEKEDTDPNQPPSIQIEFTFKDPKMETYMILKTDFGM